MKLSLLLTEPVPDLKADEAKLHNAGADILKQTVLAPARGIDPLTGSEAAGGGEKEAEKFDSLRYREKQLLSAPKRGRAVMFRVMS